MSARQWCKHYRAIVHHESCAAGVTYTDITPRAFGWLKRLPCFSTNVEPLPCARCQYPTEEESAAERAAMNGAVERAMDALAAAVAEHERTGADDGVIPCPTCKGELQWVRARSSGHFHAACATPDCVRFMQ